MSISASRVVSMETTFWLENMMEAIASGSLSRSMRGEISSLMASFMVSVMRLIICSSTAANSSSLITPPATIFLRYAAMGSAAFQVSISS